MVWASTENDNERQDEKADDGDEFDRRKAEFSFAIDADCKDVEGQDNDDYDGNPYGRLEKELSTRVTNPPCTTYRYRSCAGPVVNQNRGSADIQANHDGAKIPILLRSQHGLVRYCYRKLTFQPTAKPSASSTKRPQNCGIAPGTGNQVVISPSESICRHWLFGAHRRKYSEFTMA